MAYYSRGKNKIVSPYTLKDIFNSYQKEIETDSPYDIEFSLFKQICIAFNKKTIDNILNSSGSFKVPFRLGNLSVVKLIPKDFDKRRLAVDFKATNEAGKTVYHVNSHSNGYKCMFYWNKQTSNIKYKTYYRFIPTRAIKRELASNIKNRTCDYFEKPF